VAKEGEKKGEKGFLKEREEKKWQKEEKKGCFGGVGGVLVGEKWVFEGFGALY